MGSLARAKQENTHTRAGGKSEQDIHRTYVEKEKLEGREAFPLPLFLSSLTRISPLCFFAMYTMLANNISAVYLTPSIFLSHVCPRVCSSALGLTKHILNLST